MNCIDNNKKQKIIQATKPILLQDIVAQQRSAIEAEQIILNECTTFVKKIMGDPESPWNQNILGFAHKNGNAYLSKYQKNLLKILQGYFQRDMPFFVQQKFTAKQLGCDRTRVTRIVSALVNKDLILKINWFYKGKYRVLLLPSTPEISKIIHLERKTRSAIPPFDDWLMNNMCTCALLIQKLPKSLRIPTCVILYTLNIYIYTINRVNSNFIFKEINCSYEQYTPKSVCDVPSLFFPGKEKILRYKLKIKKSTDTNKKNPLINKPWHKQKVNLENPKLIKSIDKIEKALLNFQILDCKSLNTFFSAINLKYGKETHVDYLFKGLNRLDQIYCEKERKVLKMLVWLLKNNTDLNYVFTKELTVYYNAIKNNRFTKTKIGNTNKFIKIVIAATYRLHNSANHDKSMMYTAIDRLNQYGGQVKEIKFLKKWDILDFLLDFKNKDYFKKFMQPTDAEFGGMIFQRKPKYDRANEKFKEIYAQSLYPDNYEKGTKLFNQYQFILTRFLDNMIDRVLNEDRNLEGFKLTVPVIDNYEEKAPLMQEYILFLCDFLGRKCSPTQIEDYWDVFIRNKMRGEYGYNDFWKRNKK